MRKIFYFLFLLIFVESCNNKNNDIEDYKIFCYNEPSNITSLDPVFSRSMSNIWAVNQIFNGLVQLDEDLNILPCIAKRWKISENGTKYIFVLRDDVFFHENSIMPEIRKVVANDFVYSFNRILDPDVASPGTWIFQNVKRDSLGKPLFYDLDDTTFVVELISPFPPFLGMLAMQYCSVVPHEVVEFYGKDFRKNPVGTGPFMFKYWKENVKLVLIKNNNYFEKDDENLNLPYLDAVNVTFIVDRQTAFLDFLKGNIDMISGIDATYKDALLDKSGNLKDKYSEDIYLQSVPFLNTEYLGFLMDSTNQNFNDAIKNIKVRQAINYCFDRKKMVRYLRNDLCLPGIFGFVPPYMPGFDLNVQYGYNYNPEKARVLLAEAGYPNGKGLPEITLAATSNYMDLCQYIQHEASKVGISMKIDLTQPATLREMNANGKVEFFRASWIADYPDAENYLSLFYSKNYAPFGPNYTRFQNDFFDELYLKSISVFNDSLRYSLYRQMDSVVMFHAPVIVLYYDRVVRFVRNDIDGLTTNPMNLLDLKSVRKK